MNAPKRWAIICSNYINASSIVTSLKANGWEGPIICIKEDPKAPVLTDLMKKDAATWSIPMQQPEDLLSALSERIPVDDHKIIFFCDERFLEVFRDRGNHLLPNSRFFIGSSTHLDIILDRFAFYKFIDQHGLAKVPRTIDGDEDPWTEFNNGFFIRPKKTWKNLQRLPRVKLVRNIEQQVEVEAYFKVQGLESSHWCYQEILSLDPRDNISICGWHDPKTHVYFATHHLLRHPEKVGNGDVTGLLSGQENLMESCSRVLGALNYEGPFEMEYVLDRSTGDYKIIELNPRFWMQHGLIERVSGHELVKKYTGVDADSVSLSDQDVRYWINSFYAAFRIFKGDLRVIRYLLGSHALVAPGWSLALNYSFSILNQKLIKLVIR